MLNLDFCSRLCRGCSHLNLLAQQVCRRDAVAAVMVGLLLILILGPGERVLAQGQDGKKVELVDSRSGPLKTLNGYFPFDPPETLEEWDVRRNELRDQLKVALGLWPMPTRTSLNPVVHGRIELDEYTIEKVYFESMPGFFVTGNLYRPSNVAGEVPAVLCPHGHFRDGRFRKGTPEETARQIGQGGETFFSNATSPLQARCAHLAKMGCVVFHYDMLGYADSQQLSYDLAHRFAKPRFGMNQKNAWGLFSSRAEAHLQSVMGLQTWNSIRALDFLETLPDVDPKRIGVTGGSGGGTQTMMLCAIDDRPAVSFPAVMVSTAMQGGCTCENCCYLRIGTGNVEIAALFAPKPQGLSAANDWTREMETKGFPQLKELYALYRKSENIQLTSRTEFPHNYNQVSREAMYAWFAKHLGLESTTKESETKFHSSLELTVYNYPEHKAPPSGDEFERELLQWWKKDVQTQLKTILDKSFRDFRQLMRPVLHTMVGRKPTAKTVFQEVVEFKEVELEDGSSRYVIVVKNGLGEFVRGVAISPEKSRDLLLLANEQGSLALDAGSPLRPLVDEFLNSGFSVLCIDHLFLNAVTRHANRLVPNNREAAGYTFGYNSPQLVKRIHAYIYELDQEETTDELDVFADEAKRGMEQGYFVVALDNSAIDIAVAMAFMSVNGEADQVKGLILDTGKFRFEDISTIRDPYFLPGAARYFDLPGFLSLAAPVPMMVFGETQDSLDLVIRSYQESGHPGRLSIIKKTEGTLERNSKVISWLEANRKD